MIGRRMTPFDATLVTLGALLVFIEVGLATDGNWPKMLHLAIAQAVLAALLLGPAHWLIVRRLSLGSAA